MKKVFIILTTLIISNISFGGTIQRENKANVNRTLTNKSCVQARNFLLKKGWKPFPALDGVPSQQNKYDWNKDIFAKYPELEHCYPTGLGLCYGRYQKGNQYLLAEFSGQGGDLEVFESKYCSASVIEISKSYK